MESQKPKVYFTKEISPEKVLEMFKILNKELPGKVCVKVHSGEKGNQNFFKPEFFKPIVDHLNATVVECNTGYNGARATTEKHKQVLEEHGWTKTYPTNFEILDADGEIEFPIPNGKLLKKNWIGKGIQNYQSCVIVSHFKGHISGGFGGAMKQLSIGFASSHGKAYQHHGGAIEDPMIVFDKRCSAEHFQESMADTASAVINYFKGNLAYVNVMKNISMDCDCNGKARPPCMKDIGILSSVDPVAIDRACLDLVYKSEDPGKEDLIKRIEERCGPYGNKLLSELGCGSVEYELVNLDK